jgi:hypothetical protein
MVIAPAVTFSIQVNGTILGRFVILGNQLPMNSTETYDDWAIGIDLFWREQSIPLEPGVPEAYIHQTGKDLGVEFPDALVALYKRVNGFTRNNWNPGMFVIWPLERMLEEHVIEKDQDFVGFSDYLICSHIIGFRKDKEGIWKNYDLHSAVCATFEEAIELINADSILVN